MSINPNTMSFVLPGGNYKLADIVAMEEQCVSISDSSLLELGWEVLVLEKRSSVTTTDLAQVCESIAREVNLLRQHQHHFTFPLPENPKGSCTRKGAHAMFYARI